MDKPYDQALEGSTPDEKQRRALAAQADVIIAGYIAGEIHPAIAARRISTLIYA